MWKEFLIFQSVSKNTGTNSTLLKWISGKNVESRIKHSAGMNSASGIQRLTLYVRVRIPLSPPNPQSFDYKGLRIFSYSPNRFMDSALRYWLPYIGLKFQRKGPNLRTDYARKSGGRSPRLYQLRRKTPPLGAGSVNLSRCVHNTGPAYP